MEEPLTRSLLRGLTVVEVAGRSSGRYAATLLEALGAEVHVVKPGALGADVHAVDSDAGALGSRLAEVDVLLTSGENGDPGTDPDPAGRRRSGLDFVGVQVDLSPYGSTGPCRSWKGDDTTLAAHAGLAAYVGEAEREPLVPPVGIISHQAGIAAACAALAELGHGPRTLEVAEFDVFATTHMMGLYPLAFFSGAIPRRAGRRKPAPYPFTHLPCADGWVCVAFLEGRQWARFVEVMGSPEWTSDERYRDRRRMGEQYPDEVDALVIPWLKTKTKAELLALALEQRLPIVPLRTVEEVLASEQLAAREFFRTEEIDGRKIIQPGLPFHFTPAGERSDGPRRAVAEDAARPDRGGPLAGRLVLDLGRVASAPCVAQWLADLGADVIKVESRTHLDSTRKGRPLLAADVVAGDAGRTPDLMPFFLSINRGKRSLVLDLAGAAGRSVLDRLVERADVLIENFGSGGLERFGLGPDHLHALRPELVVIRISAVGQTGLDAALPGYAPHSTAAAGLDDLCRYPGGEPVGMIAGNFGDVNTAAFGALGALAGLRAGTGGTFDVSMLESNATHLGPTLLAREQGGGPETQVTGGQSPMARCSGDDEWVAASPRTAEERAAATHITGTDFLPWAASRGSAEAAAALQAAGVPAAPVLGAEDLLFAEETRIRDVVVEVPHPVLGSVPVHGVPITGGAEFMAVRGRAPDLGQHTAEILADFGFSAAEISELEAAGAFDGPI